MAYSDVILAESSLVSYWRLGTGATDLTDTSGLGHTFVKTGTPVEVAGLLAGDANTARNFTGNVSTQRYDYSGAALSDFDFLGTASFSIEAWVKIETISDTTAYYRILGHENGTDGWNLGCRGSGSGFLVTRRGIVCQDGVDVTLNLPHHVVGTYDGSNLRLYVDGALAGGPTAAVAANAAVANSVRTGPYTGINYIDGTMDELAVYNVALTLAQVQAHYNAGIPTTPSAPQITQSTGGDAQISLTWSAPTYDGGSAILSYKIYRSTTPGAEVLLVNPPGTGTTYVDSTVVNGTPYYYQVSAVNAIGESTRSNEASATPQATVISTPTLTLKRLCGPTLLTNAATTLYTCPIGSTAVIRHIHVSNPSGAPVNFTFSIGASSAGTRLWDAEPIAAGDYDDHLVEHNLFEGEVIQAFGSLDSVLNLTVDGYEAVGASDQPVYPADNLFPHD